MRRNHLNFPARRGFLFGATVAGFATIAVAVALLMLPHPSEALPGTGNGARTRSVHDRKIMPARAESSPTAEFLNHVARGHQPIRIETFAPGEARVVYFGEQHTDPRPKLFLARHMRELRALGFTHLAVEMVNASHQDSLDGLCAGTVSREAFIERLNGQWPYGARNPDYTSAFQAACAAGMKILALDVRDELAKLPGRRPPNGELSIGYRDRAMAATLAKTVAEGPEVRIIALVGALHALTSILDVANPAPRELVGTRTQPQLLLEDHGITSRSYRFESETNMLFNGELQHHELSYEWAARKLGLPTGGHMIDTRRESTPFDGVILKGGEPEPALGRVAG